MMLIERDTFIASLDLIYRAVANGEGHCVMLCGEAGIGKTSLVKAFCKEKENICKIYLGTCDALFTPRPLAPFYDIIWQFGKEVGERSMDITDKSELFARFFHALSDQKGLSLIVIEDIHWADEATLDFIKFLGRRIGRLQCLLLLTYRDDEIHSRHPLRNVFGQLATDSFTRLQLTPLSRRAVEALATERGYKGEDVYSVTGGNPFYVNEILASYNTGVPDNIRDSVLSLYNRLDEKTREFLRILSVIPNGLPISYLETIEFEYAKAIQDCIDFKILVYDEHLMSFKHELYRRTIETSLSPLVRVSLNKRVLDLFLPMFEQHKQTERIVHHAKNANEHALVVQYAPIAARQSAMLGAHIEASRLYRSTIEYSDDADKDRVVQLYEAYSYECYLTDQIKEAIIYTTKALHIWKEKNDLEKIGDSLRFLSRLWWFDGNRKKAESYSTEALEFFADLPSSRAKAMAISNESQLKMLSDHPDECIFWGNKAIAMAKELADDEILCHALNNVGTLKSRILSSRAEGIKMLQQSLEIALTKSYQEHAARAYTNLGNSGVIMRDYAFAKRVLEPGMNYCEDRDLDSWITLMHSENARMNFETGHWDKALAIAESILDQERQVKLGRIDAIAVLSRITMRRTKSDVRHLLLEAISIASQTTELQRMTPALVASLEYEWITGQQFIERTHIDHVLGLISKIGNVYENNEFAFWLMKARNEQAILHEHFPGFQFDNPAAAIKAAEIWRQLGCPYEEALALFGGSEDDKKIALSILHKLGAQNVLEKMKYEMRSSGIKNIPRGLRKSTRGNVANLTERELEILRLLKDGLQNKEIATQLFISPKTVDNHITSILYKLEVNSRVKAVQEAFQLGIIS